MTVIYSYFDIWRPLNRTSAAGLFNLFLHHHQSLQVVFPVRATWPKYRTQYPMQTGKGQTLCIFHFRYLSYTGFIVCKIKTKKTQSSNRMKRAMNLYIILICIETLKRLFPQMATETSRVPHRFPRAHAHKIKDGRSQLC